MQYTVFRTKWGYFGLAGAGESIARTCLPLPRREEAEEKLLQSLGLTDANPRMEKDFQQNLQRRICDYYEGDPVDFRIDPALHLDRAGPFALAVLAACRNIGFGQTTTYGTLAQTVGHPKAARAVGSIMAGNPIPLIVPCHRILRMDGGLGGFSAPGGITVKQRMLDHEQARL